MADIGRPKRVLDVPDRPAVPDHWPSVEPAREPAREAPTTVPAEPAPV